MPIDFAHFWDIPANNNGATAAEILTILETAEKYGKGDEGLRKALSTDSSQVTVTKGIHPDYGTTYLHITISYLGALWHVELAETAQGGKAGYRVRNVTQSRG